MGNTFKRMGLAAIITVIVLSSFAACGNGADPDDEDGDGVYTVTFNRNNTSINGDRPSGTPPSGQNITSGFSITLPGGGGMWHSKAVFNGWNTRQDGTGTSYQEGDDFTPTADTTLYAKWREGWRVTFNLNGGTGDAPPDVITNTSADWDTIDDLPKVMMPYGSGFSREGYTFAGWTYLNKVNPSGSYQWVSGHTTIYAAWELAEGYCIVTLNLNGGSKVYEPTVTVLPATVLKGEEMSLRASFSFGSQMVSVSWLQNNTPYNSEYFSRTGYTFDGWNTMADGTGTNYGYGILDLSAGDYLYYDYGGSFTPTGNITLYARWKVTPYTVIFANSANNAVLDTQEVYPGDSITLPDSAHSLVPYAGITGWNTKADGSGTQYQPGSSYTPTGDRDNISTRYITLYAQVEDVAPLNSATGLSNKLLWLQAHAQSGASYTVQVDADESISPQFFFPKDTYGFNDPGRSNITITLTGISVNRTISLSSNGAMFTVNNGNTLILGNNITLRGHSDNTDSLIVVQPEGTLIMNNGSAITENNNAYVHVAHNTSWRSDAFGGGVYVSGGIFTMNGGIISGNAADSSGGGVFVFGDGTFTMSNGTISGNTADGLGGGGGGGVSVNGGTFTMNGGTISGNTGGGVWVNGTFTMSDGTISGNTADSSGGGVYLENGTFAMSDGTISSNTADGLGGGVYVRSGTFTMSNGTISGNTTANYGGGVFVQYNGAFTMSNGTISGNTAAGGSYYNGSYYGGGGGGVYMIGEFTTSGGLTFNKTGGTIYGYSNGTGNDNVVKDNDGNVVSDSGHAVYISIYGSLSGSKRRETTAGPGVDLSYINGAFNGGWEN